MKDILGPSRVIRLPYAPDYGTSLASQHLGHRHLGELTRTPVPFSFRPISFFGNAGVR